MKRLLIATIVSLCCLSSIASPPSSVRAEIEALLTRLQESGCQFNRNGSWYNGAEAKNHLLRKLKHIKGKSVLQNTEQFIELAASRSSVSDKPYQVRCEGQPPVTSKAWLTQELSLIRTER